jgi:hypothetical protein
MSRPPVFLAEGKARIVLSVLVGEIAVADATASWPGCAMASGGQGPLARPALERVEPATARHGALAPT